MSDLSRRESRKKYSWWWDSHISPKNSKWLKQNLTGMDSKVKQMIKLIEEDADSFARRAEMYYKRRPELLRLVEDFYRAYRALAERYDHATGVIRHAHKTMVEAFPDQVASLMMDEQVDDNGPFRPPSVCEFFEPDELHKDGLGIPSLDLPTAKPEFLKSRRGLKQQDIFEKGGARKGLNFNESQENGNKHDADTLALKEALVKLEAEKEDVLIQYQKSLERLSSLENEIMLAQEDSKKLFERASQAEAEVELLKGALIELKAEKELVLLHYHQCLEKISILENHIIRCEGVAKGTSVQSRSAKNEAQLLKQELDELRAEKESISAQHEQCMETISVIETKLQQAEENARRSTERAEMAESKVDNLNLAITELSEENEAYAVQCQQYLERISTLEFQILFAQDENKRLNEEISNGEAKLKNAEEHCLSVEFSHQSLQSKLDSLIGKMESSNVDLTEKQIELGRLWTCVQEERLRFVEAETAFQTLQHLHNESQEELTALSSELHNRAQTVSYLEVQNQRLQEEMLKIKEDNNMLNEINLSSEASIRNMQKEISNLRATISKLEEEIERQVNERNTLHQEIYSLGKEFSELKQKHGAVLEQMESLELDPLSFGSSVKELHDNISKLSDACQMEKSEKSALLEKLDNMPKLLEKNALLENSIVDLNSELKQVKEKIKTLEDTCQILEEEKAAAVSERNVMDSQVQILSENIAALSTKNVSLENALADAGSELELLKEKSRTFEESLLKAGIDKTKLLNENGSLSSKLKSTTQRLVEVETKNKELEAGILNMEAEKKLLVSSIDELRNLLDSTKRENFNSIKFYQTRLTSLECQLHLLRKEAQLTEKLYNEEVDKSSSAEIEISVLWECLRELHSNNSSLGLECLKVFEASSKSEMLIAYMEQKNADQQVELEALTNVLKIIRTGFLQIKKTKDDVVTVSPACKYENKVVSHLQPQFIQTLEALEDIKKAFAITVDENHQLVLEKSVLITLLGQLQLDTADLDLEKCILSKNLKTNAQRLLTLLSEAHVLLETNEGLKGTVKEGLLIEKTLRNNIQELKELYELLQKNNCMVMEENKSLEIKVLDLQDAKFALEEEIHDIFLVLKHFISEKSLEVKELNERMNQLRCIKDTLEELISKLEQKLENVQTDKSCLMRMIKGSETELKIARINSSQRNDGIANEKELLQLKELELSEANSKIEALQNEQTTLQRIIEDLKAVKEKQANQIRKLSEKNQVKSEENEELLGSKQCLETALSELRKKHKNAKTRELNLKSELQRWRNKEILWEAEYFELFSSLQIAAVNETCYLEKFRDFRKFFECMMMSKGNSTYADAEAQFLKERIVNLEAENAGLKAHFSDYESAVNSLSGSAASLERQTIFHGKIPKVDGAKDVGSVGLAHEQVQGEESHGKVGSGASELKNLQSRIEAVELVDDIKRPASDRSLDFSVRAQASSNTTTDESESSRIWRLERAGVGQRKTYNSEASSEIMELPRDIMLDQISACSSYGLSRREITPADDHMLELWGSTSRDSSMNYSEVRSHRFVSHRKDISIIGIVSENEMATVDKLEISRSPKHPQQKRKNVKILERLLFDAQKLSNIQKQVHDLKIKVELAEQSRKSTGVLEYDTVKEQLEEAEEAIDKLFCVNHRLTQTVEYDSSSPKSISGNSSDEGVILRKRRVLEQIRRASEKISHLNFMVQKLQFLLINLEGEKQEMIKARIVPRSSRVRLRDYLYSGGRPVFAHKQKRRHFCGWIRTPTKGDIST